MRRMTMPAKFGWGLMTFGVVLLALFALRYFLFGREAYFELNRQSYINHEAGILLHIGAMMIGVLMGPTQFLRGFRDKHRGIHRTMGKVYLVASTIGGFSGMYMAFYTYADAISGVSFFLLGTGVVLSNYMAYTAIRRRDVTTHREWMTRSFALMLAAVTLRIEVAPLQAIFGEYTGYAIVAWSCWVANILVAEWWIRKQRHAQPEQRISPASGVAAAQGPAA
jgi:uncharacterized membrane protein